MIERALLVLVSIMTASIAAAHDGASHPEGEDPPPGVVESGKMHKHADWYSASLTRGENKFYGRALTLLSGSPSGSLTVNFSSDVGGCSAPIVEISLKPNLPVGGDQVSFPVTMTVTVDSQLPIEHETKAQSVQGIDSAVFIGLHFAPLAAMLDSQFKAGRSAQLTLTFNGLTLEKTISLMGYTAARNAALEACGYDFDLD